MACSRREFFGDFVRSLIPVLEDTETCNRPAQEYATWLRPPGALPEAEFLETCTRCTDCIEACPYESIRRLGPEFEHVAGTPVIIPDESPCYLCEDMPCIQACSPHALVHTDREAVRMGTAQLNVSDCYLTSGQPCDYCVTRCPLTSTAITWSSDRLPLIHEDNCTGCAVCAYLCPADAIAISTAT